MFVNETDTLSRMGGLQLSNCGPLIMLLVKSHKCVPPHEHVAFIKLKQANYIECVQLVIAIRASLTEK